MAENIYTGMTGLAVLLAFTKTDDAGVVRPMDLSLGTLTGYMRTPRLNTIAAEDEGRDPDGAVDELEDVTVLDAAAGSVRVVLPELADAGTYTIWATLSVAGTLSESTPAKVFVRRSKTP